LQATFPPFLLSPPPSIPALPPALDSPSFRATLVTFLSSGLRSTSKFQPSFPLVPPWTQIVYLRLRATSPHPLLILPFPILKCELFLDVKESFNKRFAPVFCTPLVSFRLSPSLSIPLVAVHLLFSFSKAFVPTMVSCHHLDSCPSPPISVRIGPPPSSRFHDLDLGFYRYFLLTNTPIFVIFRHLPSVLMMFSVSCMLPLKAPPSSKPFLTNEVFSFYIPSYSTRSTAPLVSSSSLHENWYLPDLALGSLPPWVLIPISFK